MKDTVKVAVVQMDVVWLEPTQNVAKMEEFVRTISSTSPVDFIVFPELTTTGYVIERDREFGLKFIQLAERIPGPSTNRLCRIAQKAKVNIVFGFCEAHKKIPGTLYNSAIIVSKEGEIIGVHRKLHIPAEEKHYFRPGSTVSTFQTDIANIGLSVCADNRFPEYIRILALRGAEIVFGLFNVPSYDPPVISSSLPDLECLASVRALENVNYFIACDRTGSQKGMRFRGKSVIAAPTGQLLAVSKSNGEEVIFAELENKLLLRDRGFNPVFRDRRPELYAPLCDPF